MKNRTAFTMIELIFVIVIMGIIGKFGVEFLAQAYKSFIFSSVNNTLQQNSANAVEFIGSRLQYRIKDSTIARVGVGTPPVAIGSALDSSYTVLEWVASDVDSFRGDATPSWSAIIDLDASSATTLVSPGSNTGNIDTLVNVLSYGDSGIEDTALYFIGANSDVVSGYGWDGNLTLVNAQQGTMHPVNISGNVNEFVSSTGTDFTGVDLYEYYKLAWTANAIVYTDDGTGKSKGTLTFWYDYQPWLGESYSDGKSATIMEDISTFQFMAIDSIIKIQVCVKSDLVEEYSLCKEKTIF
ncbi:MAG: type II secretion system protein [Campylobacterota bacterium]|nr:type II secretion system protein [Campylobacterota bacterium]